MDAAHDGPASDSFAEDLAAFGAASVELPGWMREVDPDADGFGVLEENWIAVHVFFDCATQWRTNHEGVATGLDYAGVQAVIELDEVENARDSFARVRVMELAAIREFAKRAK